MYSLYNGNESESSSEDTAEGNQQAPLAAPASSFRGLVSNHSNRSESTFNSGNSSLMSMANTSTSSAQSSQEQLPGEEKIDIVAVFNAQTKAGGSMVRALSKGGQHVVAIVRSFNSRNTKRLLKLPRVTVKAADDCDEDALADAVEGVNRAFLMTKYWERFDTWLEESQAHVIVRACGKVGVSHLVLSSVEDAMSLKEEGGVSQLVPDKKGNIHPKFEGMRNLRQDAKDRGVQLTHMFTSYLDKEHSKQSVCLMMSDNGQLLMSVAR